MVPIDWVILTFALMGLVALALGLNRKARR